MGTAFLNRPQNTTIGSWLKFVRQIIKCTPQVPSLASRLFSLSPRGLYWPLFPWAHLPYILQDKQYLFQKPIQPREILTLAQPIKFPLSKSKVLAFDMWNYTKTTVLITTVRWTLLSRPPWKYAFYNKRPNLWRLSYPGSFTPQFL